MHNRYRKPAERSSSLEFFEDYLRDAQPGLSERSSDPKAAEARRIKAVAALLALARAEVAKADEIEPRPLEPRTRLRAMPLRLCEFLTIAGLRILTADDPTEALQRFLGQQPGGRGRPSADNAFRDHMIAADVAELHASGKSIEAACEAVADAAALSPEAVRKIYFAGRNILEVKAELEWRALGWSAFDSAPEDGDAG